jgi:hypothetical protein
VKLILAAVAMLALAACSDTDPAVEDLDPDVVSQDREPRLVYVMPDTYPNILVFCDGPVRVYLTTREALPLAVVADHPACRG